MQIGNQKLQHRLHFLNWSHVLFKYRLFVLDLHWKNATKVLYNACEWGVKKPWQNQQQSTHITEKYTDKVLKRSFHWWTYYTWFYWPAFIKKRIPVNRYNIVICKTSVVLYLFNIIKCYNDHILNAVVTSCVVLLQFCYSFSYFFDGRIFFSFLLSQKPQQN